MLQQFSWTQFLLFAGVLSLLWYVFVLLTAYSNEVKVFLKLRPGVEASIAAPVAGPDAGKPVGVSLMGESKLPDGMETVSLSKLSFSVSDEVHQAQQLGLIPDVLQELKELFSVLATEDGSKSDFLSLLEIIKTKYGAIASHPNIGQVNAFIRSHALFAISPEELENLWD